MIQLPALHAFARPLAVAALSIAAAAGPGIAAAHALAPAPAPVMRTASCLPASRLGMQVAMPAPCAAATHGAAMHATRAGRR